MNEVIRTLGREIASYTALKKWRQRGEVPHVHRLRMLALARQRGLPLREADFEFEPTSLKERQRQNGIAA